MSGECPVQQRDGLIQSQEMLSLPQPQGGRRKGGGVIPRPHPPYSQTAK